ncbi:AAA family ATPase [Sphingosinicella sp.]|uniref:AAA family ATPase n=1 Tax=Sphingosinicella sp. TaxID=1917971 RepID=UPI0040377E34
MLYRLEIENFFSIRDPQILDVIVAPNVSDPDARYCPIFEGSELRAPKVLALYGPNASGKTTVLRALEFIVSFVRDSSQRTVPGFSCERFNDEPSRWRPIRLAIEFGGVMDFTVEVRERAEQGEPVQHGVYRYELEIEVEDGAPHRVTSEILRQKPGAKGKWQRVFERDQSGDVVGSKSFPLSGYRHLINTLRPNASVISSFAMFQHPTAQLFQEAARKVLSIMAIGGTIDDAAVIEFLAQRPDLVEMLNRDLKRVDVGVEAMRIERGSNGPMPMFRHEGLQVEMPWILESHGTRTFIRLFPLLAMTLGQGGIAIIDEFDVMIHPLVLPELLRWFYDKEQRNPLDAQIWLSCHSASLLDDLTKEEVILCEKDHQGRTQIFSLMDMKSIRRDDNLYRKYLSGVYGAVPQIG